MNYTEKKYQIVEGNVAYIQGVPRDILDLVNKKINTEATGDGVTYVSVEELDAWLEENGESSYNRDDVSDKVLSAFINDVYNQSPVEFGIVALTA